MDTTQLKRIADALEEILRLVKQDMEKTLYEVSQLKRIADALEEILRLVKADQEKMEKYRNADEK